MEYERNRKGDTITHKIQFDKLVSVKDVEDRIRDHEYLGYLKEFHTGSVFSCYKTGTFVPVKSDYKITHDCWSWSHPSKGKQCL